MKIQKRSNDHYFSSSDAEEESLDLEHMNTKTIRIESIQRKKMSAIGIMMRVQESWSYSNIAGDTRHGRLKKENIITGKFKELQQ